MFFPYQVPLFVSQKTNNFEPVVSLFKYLWAVLCIAEMEGCIRSTSVKNNKPSLNSVSIFVQFIKLSFGLVWFAGFYGTLTFVGYFTPNPFLCK